MVALPGLPVVDQSIDSVFALDLHVEGRVSILDMQDSSIDSLAFQSIDIVSYPAISICLVSLTIRPPMHKEAPVSLCKHFTLINLIQSIGLFQNPSASWIFLLWRLLCQQLTL